MARTTLGTHGLSIRRLLPWILVLAFTIPNAPISGVSAQTANDKWKRLMERAVSASVSKDLREAELSYRQAALTAKHIPDGGVCECESVAGILNTLILQGKLEDAEPIYQRFLRTCTDKKSKGSITTREAVMVDEVADAYQVKAGEFDRKGSGSGQSPRYELCLKHAIDLRAAVLGGRHPALYRTRIQLARSYARYGKSKEAIPFLEQAAVDRHPNFESIDNLVFLGGCYEDSGQSARAQATFSRARKAFEQIGQHGRLNCCRGEYLLYFGKGGKKRHDRAGKFLLAALNETEESNENLSCLIKINLCLADVFVDNGDLRQAERYARTGVSQSQKLYGKDSVKNQMAFDKLIAVLKLSGKFKEAAQIAQVRSKMTRSLLPVDGELSTFFTPEIEASRKAGAKSGAKP